MSNLSKLDNKKKERKRIWGRREKGWARNLRINKILRVGGGFCVRFWSERNYGVSQNLIPEGKPDSAMLLEMLGVALPCHGSGGLIIMVSPLLLNASSCAVSDSMRFVLLPEYAASAALTRL